MEVILAIFDEPSAVELFWTKIDGIQENLSFLLEGERHDPI